MSLPRECRCSIGARDARLVSTQRHGATMVDRSDTTRQDGTPHPASTLLK
ncbi:hypothetical protein D187_001991 [Cystobacter fuscus DSM 2262]|uniref:Uncharacterized protein n=1 Tax=Cystobacter fuscus (strain ATCC 25194 / DSM 2262 / NBRC 100088 / M29) TaxID=1242864 RepID=S9QGR0_CYSF2|nr:hypothetical protein D187_001991 [Cystobacter fuscus DSM 2262]